MRGLRTVVNGLAVGLVIGLVPFVPALAAAPGYAGAQVAKGKSTPVTTLTSTRAAAPELPVDVPGPAAVWPSGGAAVIDLAAGSVDVTVGGLPVEVSTSSVSDVLSSIRHRTAADSVDGPDRVRIEILDPSTTQLSGFPLVAKVSRADGSTADTSLNLELGYAAFRNAFGAGWQSRLRLVLLPCGTVMSELDQCRPVPLQARNDVAAGVISAQVPVTATLTPAPTLSAKQAAAQGVELGTSADASEPGAVVALASSPESSVGDFTRTDLKASSQWSAGSNSGDFTYSYDFPVPPVPSGLTPPLALSYSSGSVDGVTGHENTQPSWIGEGWNLQPGSIERTLRPCAQDQDHSPFWTVKSGDRCWRHDNFQISFGGRSGELVPTGSGNVWKLANDDGSRLQLLTDGSYAGGERWLLTDKSGTQYWFGMTRLPGWRAAAPNNRETQSILAAPAFANHSGEPCFQTSAFRNSRCTQQAYRWQLDYVVDVHGNSMSYWYGREANRTALAGDTGLGAGYDRAGYLLRVEYGTRAGQESAPGVAPAIVEFTVDNRCLTSSCGTKDRVNWPDTPHDLTCIADPCYAKNPSPSFWTTKRLSKVSTKVRDNGLYTLVDEWELTHQFPATGSSMQHPALWLYAISRTGYSADAGEDPLPPVTFGGLKLNNRADWDTGMEPHYKYRISQINTETGGRITVAYYSDDSGCAHGTTPPPTGMNNRRCFPQLYTNQAEETGWTWWHKRVVYRVVLEDLVGGSPDVTTEYVYSLSEAVPGSGQNTVLWGFTKGVWGTVHKTWSQWAGYAGVHTRTGDPAAPYGPARTHTKTVYFQGLDRDETNAGSFTRSNKIVDSTGALKVDHQALAGQVRETLTFNGDGGSTIGRTLTDYTLTQTAGGTLPSWQTPAERKAFMVTKTDQQDSTWLAHNSTWRISNTITNTDAPYGNVSTVEDHGDLAVTGDETCTKYLYTTVNTGRNLLLHKGTGAQATSSVEGRGTLLGVDNTADQMMIGEFTSDGKKDMIARTVSDGKLWLYPGDGAGGFGTGTAIGSGFTTDWDQVFSPGDFNGDGRNDVLARRLSDSKLFMFQGNGAGGWLNNGNGTLITAFGSDYGPMFSAGDFNGDGKPDVIARVASTTKLHLYPGNGAGGLLNGGNGTIIGTGFNTDDYDKILSAGDINGDSKPDVLARRTFTSQLIAYHGNGTTLPGTEQVYAEATHPYEVIFGNGDLTGDTKPDLYTRATNNNWITGTVSRTQHWAAACTTAMTPANTLGDTRTFYDNTPHAAIPVYGMPTRSEAIKEYNGATPSYVATTQVSYDKLGRAVSVTDPIGRTASTAFTHTADGLLSKIEVTNPAGHKASTTSDVTRGQLLSVVDANGKTATGSYDNLGRLTKVWKPGHPISGTADAEYVYTISNTAPTWVSSKTLGPNGNQIVSYDIYDGFLQLRQSQGTAPDGKRTITDTRYDKRGQSDRSTVFYNNASGPTSTLLTFSDADIDRQARTTYDGLGRATANELWSRNAMVAKTTTIYGGDRTAVIPPAGGTTVQDLFNVRGNTVEKRQFPTSDLNSTPDKTLYQYDLLNQLTRVTDPANNIWTYSRDLLGRTTQTVDPDAGTSKATFDDAGQKLTSTDGRNITLVHKLDSLGRQTHLYQTSITPANKLAEWTYDSVAIGQLTSATRFDAGKAYVTSVGSYDDGYRPLSTTVTAPGFGTGGSDLTYTVTNTYKPSGTPATKTLPGVGGLPNETLTSTYSDQGTPTGLTGSWPGGGSQTYLSNTSYSYDGLLTQHSLGNPGKKTRHTAALDPATRRLTKLQLDTENLTAPGSFLDRFTSEYAYDLAGNVTTIAGQTDGAIDQVECFRYDHLGRLVTAFTNSTWDCATPTRAGADPYHREWTFDTIGNRKTQTDINPDADDTLWTYISGAAGGVKPHQVSRVDAAGPRAGTATRSFAYDNAGNTLSRTSDNGTPQTLTWTPESNLASVTEGTNVTSYVYGASGERLLAKTPTQSTLYLPDGTELELPAAGGAILGTRHYGDLAVRDATGLKWVTADHHNTGQVQLDSITLQANRRRTMPYGEDRGQQSTSWMGTKGYVGGTKEDTGLTHLGAREYDPTLGRFTSVDPIMDLADPRQWNAYSYSHNNPVTYSDPSGLHDCAGFDCADGSGNGGQTTPQPPTPTVPPAAPTSPSCNGYLALQSGCGPGTDTATGGGVGYPYCGGSNSPCPWVTGKCADSDTQCKIVRAVSLVIIAVGALIILAPVIAFVGIEGGAALLLATADVEAAMTIGGVTTTGIGGGIVAGRGGWALFKAICTHSFAAGTLVLLADGTTKAIEDVTVGDIVLATDPETGETVARPVVATHVNQDQDLTDLTVNDEAGNQATISTTWHHPFWSQTRLQWIDARDLAPGEQLQTTGGTVTVIHVESYIGSKTMNDLTVAEIHTYYVLAGKTPVLVHNAGGDPGPGQIYLWRAVTGAELYAIQSGRAFTNPAGIETKYFSYSERGAAEYARRAYGAYPGEGPYTIIRTTINSADIPASSIMPHTADVIDGGVALPSDKLDKLGRPRIMTGMSTGIGC